MDAHLDAICKKLEETAARFLNLNSPGKTLRDANGWQFPALSREDFAGMAIRLANQLRAADIQDIDTSDIDMLADFPRRLELLWTETLPHIFNGQPPAVYAYTETIRALERVLSPFIAVAEAGEGKYLPPRIITRIKAANRRIDRIEASETGLQERVEIINRAHSSAERLSTTLQELEDAQAELEELRSKIEKISDDSIKKQGQIDGNVSSSITYISVLEKQAKKAEELIAKCEDAFQIATTKGLAGAFDQRAEELKKSITVWVFLLLLALCVGGIFGSNRVDALSQLTSSGHPDWGIITLHVVLSILTVGGPLWFAWLSTKQIGQRFRLAEDYAFKASVAKAYEGYRKQAEHLDEAFSARLFGSALTRLDEAPLRLVEKDTHGSPWHEASQSELIRTAIATVPGFTGMVADMAKKALDSAAGAVSSRFRPSAPPKAQADTPPAPIE